MAIYQGDIGIHDIKLGSIDVFEIYQGSKLVYPENTETTITFKLNVSGIVTINGYTPVISENNTKFVFTIPVKTDYTANITAEHYKSQTISGNSGYLPITHNVELEWEQRFISYTVTFPTDGVKVLFDGIEKGVITNGKLVVLIDDTEAKDSYTVTFKGSKVSIYDTSTLTVVDSAIANTGGVYDLKLPTSCVKSRYKRTDYASSTGSITKGSTYAGTWIETVVNLTASFTSSTTLGSISNNVLTIPNNESTNAKSGTLTAVFTLENKQTKEVSAALNQAAGAKVYTNWVLDLQTDGTSVEAKGGTRTVTANIARRTYKWNNTGTVYSETATPTLSISGSASLSGNQIKFTSNESVSARSATLTASYVGLSKTVTITQQAGAKVYSAWSAWTVSISASTQTIAASGGSSTITTNASRSRTWTWNGVGTTHTDTETATPTLSGSAGGFTLNGKTVTASNNTTTNSRSITITATSNSVSKSITITQSAGAKVYGNWSAWTINISADKTSIGATGGTATISTSASRTRSYTWNGVAGSGGTETGNGSPALSKVSGAGSFASNKVTYDNNTSTSARSTVIRATMDSVTKDITITQSAGAKTYSSWGAWSISLSANVTTIAAAGGNATLSTSATRSRTWQWNGTGTTYTENASGAPTLSKVNGAASLSGSTVSYGNNTSTSSRSSVFRATIDSATKDITISQSAGSKSYGSWSSWSVYCNASSYTVAASGGSVTIYYGASRSRTWTWNGVAGSGGTETENATPSLSAGSGGGTLSGSTLSYSNNTSTSVRRTRVTANYNGAINFCDIEQRAGNKVYSSWGAWSVNISASPTNIAAAGGSSTITCSAVRSIQYTWNGVGQNFSETENGSPTLSKSGDGTLSGTTSGSKLTYGNRTATTSRSTTVTATYGGITKSVNITQSAGSKVTGKMTYHTDIYDRNLSNYTDYTSYPVTHDIGGEPVISGGDTIITFCRLRKTQPWTWNGVSGSGGTDTTYASAKDVAIVSQSNCTTTVKDVGGNNIIMFSSVVPANLSSSARTWYFNWRWLGSNNTTIKNTQIANPVRGRLVIKNDYFTSQNVALPIYLDSENVDSIYKGEASYNDIKKTPIDVYVYIPTNTAIMNAGKLQFWFENKDGDSSKYTCILSIYSTPSNNISVSNGNDIITVTANTTTSSFTILCQFTMISNNTVFNVRVLIEP